MSAETIARGVYASEKGVVFHTVSYLSSILLLKPVYCLIMSISLYLVPPHAHVQKIGHTLFIYSHNQPFQRYIYFILTISSEFNVNLDKHII